MQTVNFCSKIQRNACKKNSEIILTCIRLGVHLRKVVCHFSLTTLQYYKYESKPQSISAYWYLEPIAGNYFT